MTHSTDIVTLARWMAADFSNQEQAFENPPFAHIRVCMPPPRTPFWRELLCRTSLWLYAKWSRVRVWSWLTWAHIEIENYTVKQEEQFYGAARATERLKALTTERLEKLPGCNMIVEWTGHSFKGSVEPGRACIVFRKGTKPILIANLRLTKTNLSASTEARPRNQWAYLGFLCGTISVCPLGAFADEVKV